jgi:hypothetical protein
MTFEIFLQPPPDLAAGRREAFRAILNPDLLQLSADVTAQVLAAAEAADYDEGQFRANILRLIASAHNDRELDEASDNEHDDPTDDPTGRDGPTYALWGTDCKHYHSRSVIAKSCDIELPEFIRMYLPENGPRVDRFLKFAKGVVKDLDDQRAHGQTTPSPYFAPQNHYGPLEGQHGPVHWPA